MRTESEANEEILEDAKKDLLCQNHALFMEQINLLTSYQLRFIRAVMAGRAHEINRKETIDEFQLGSSANVAVVKKALQKKEMIDIEGREIRFSDPVFVQWARQNMGILV